jgi:DNA-directed RNA polymerase subunit RPC12/RpoP
MNTEPEYWCTFCDDYVMNIDMVMKCLQCGEYKGLVKLSPTQTNGKDNQ